MERARPRGTSTSCSPAVDIAARRRIVLLVSSVLSGLVIASGVFSLALGIVHVSIPALVRYRVAIGEDGGARPPLGGIGAGTFRYELRRRDLVGIAWIMSNAASYVLVSIGLVNLAWATGDSLVPIQPVALWIAGWWALRAAGQLTVDRRPLDLAILGWFAALAALHLVVAFAGRVG